MNEDKVQRIVEEVVFRLQRRAQSNIALSTAQLRDADSRTLFSRYGNLRILLADLPLLRGIAEQNDNDIAAIKLHYALALGVNVQISLCRSLLTSLPVKKLARLPLNFCDENGQSIILHSGQLLSYADVARLRRQILVLRRRCIVTALAHEAASVRNIQLIRQE
ncbi:microcompartment protein PduM [Salmonella enterica]|uniref:Microcompartment protein PduM n=1 Tax=Salmonella enterica subsp. salamae serovar 47:b:1,5 TaxID=1967619 RepID=A0A735HNQ5_SALER|nr:microcompartment protein PduM [Salmonella enterica]EKR1462930.1 microcompartment protein PduM [Salmonella enterica subsp. salamae serovar 47:b:1,5]EAX8729525.1 microcompartment protein PduM [Salmonella enterica]EBA0247852.1 microcompartment protein PduM [Salmonella enterica]EBC1927720.1 microcompartment protein PduM [Salmonella enterica]